MAAVAGPSIRQLFLGDFQLLVLLTTHLLSRRRIKRIALLPGREQPQSQDRCTRSDARRVRAHRFR